ncbi:alpha-N-arabinofuranosidase [Streptomyces sp. CA-111067]|uniref:alpha-N-arabinofuranosidase n=1 Tax=Streptomyces sp. CA-111067 TaxID=3240046 RepID=UPI003D952FF3
MTADRRVGTVTLDPGHHRGTIDRRLFGSFVEHMGRCVYTGIHEPGHPAADAYGFRSDVAALVAELGVTLVRYPGGNFVSGYDWRDGIGPADRRPRRLDTAWRSVETNQVGTDEFLGWAERGGLQPMMAVNLGTAGITEAAALVEYCNTPGGTYWSDLRAANGRREPYGVPLWCLGNEMDGPWQTGHMSAAEYGRIAAESGKAMKLVDPGIEVVVCGSSNHGMPTFGYWESTVLERAWDVADYVSMHAYYQEHDGDRRSFLASGAAMDRFIDDVVATVDAVAARKHSRKRLSISFDEWNVWYWERFAGSESLTLDVSGPRIEDVYSALDAVVVGDLLMSLVNHSDRVRVACQAQLVNVIAPIMTRPGGEAWRQAIFGPIAATAALARGNSLVARVRGGELSTARHDDVPLLAAAATHDEASGTAAVFLTNRAAEAIDVVLDHRAFGSWGEVSAVCLAAGAEGPLHGGRAVARHAALAPLAVTADGAGTTRLTLPPESWAAVTAGSAAGSR